MTSTSLDGMPVKRLDVSLINSLGWRSTYSFGGREYKSAYEDFYGGLGIRNDSRFNISKEVIQKRSGLFELFTELPKIVGQVSNLVAKGFHFFFQILELGKYAVYLL